jgi:hypothetical protein
LNLVEFEFKDQIWPRISKSLFMVEFRIIQSRIRNSPELSYSSCGSQHISELYWVCHFHKTIFQFLMSPFLCLYLDVPVFNVNISSLTTNIGVLKGHCNSALMACSNKLSGKFWMSLRQYATLWAIQIIHGKGGEATGRCFRNKEMVTWQFFYCWAIFCIFDNFWKDKKPI